MSKYSKKERKKQERLQESFIAHTKKIHEVTEAGKEVLPPVFHASFYCGVSAALAAMGLMDLAKEYQERQKDTALLNIDDIVKATHGFAMEKADEVTFDRKPH